MVLRATQEQEEEGRMRRKMNDQGLQSIANSLDYSIDNRMQLCNNIAAAGRLGQNNMYSIPHYLLYWFLSKIL